MSIVPSASPMHRPPTRTSRIARTSARSSSSPEGPVPPARRAKLKAGAFVCLPALPEALDLGRRGRDRGARWGRRHGLAAAKGLLKEEVRMTEYNLKMINHAGVSSDRRGEIEVELQAILDEAFDASSDSVFVGWGAQSDLTRYDCIMCEMWARRSSSSTWSGRRPSGPASPAIRASAASSSAPNSTRTCP